MWTQGLENPTDLGAFFGNIVVGRIEKVPQAVDEVLLGTKQSDPRDSSTLESSSTFAIPFAGDSRGGGIPRRP